VLPSFRAIAHSDINGTGLQVLNATLPQQSLYCVSIHPRPAPILH